VNLRETELIVMQFEVERKEGGETRVEIYCAAKPGLLLSTVSKLDTLGLDIQQAVVSCFSDFGMHASCSEVRTLCLLIHSYIHHSTTYFVSPIFFDEMRAFCFLVLLSVRDGFWVQREMVSADVIKQELFKNAGYGGGCL
jgi:hypothetical protein